MTAPHIDDAAEAYALRLLDERELALGDLHMASCPRCRAAVGEYEAMAHMLLSTAPAADARECLGERVLAAYGAAVEQQRIDAVRPPVAVPPEEAGREPFWKRMFAPAPALAFALLFAVAGLATWGIVTNARLDDSNAELAQSQAALDAIASGGSVVPLEPASANATGSAVLVVPATGNPTFLISDAAVPSGDRVYEIWLLRDGQPVPAGTFRPTGDVTAVPITVDAEGFDTVAITEEPAGGSAAPTGEVLLAGAITS